MFPRDAIFDHMHDIGPVVMLACGVAMTYSRHPCLSTSSFSTRGWNGHDDEQHKGGRRVSDRTGAAGHSWPLQEIFHSTLQEPGDQREGSHTPDPAEHSQGECRPSRSKVNHCDTVMKAPHRQNWTNSLYIQGKSYLVVPSNVSL